MHYAPKVSPSRQAVRKATRSLLLVRPVTPAWQDATGERITFAREGLLARLQAKLANRLKDQPATGGATDARCAH
ncbi:MAG: hypothetical protein H7A44_07245 [Opitutaceae bacterium]|jgi:hypothetical protein|nr:hypothetical protein [Cephaloticoccus sp.]MCP5530220.1 hypothetical protein [Opitutaceae bacterium]